MQWTSFWDFSENFTPADVVSRYDKDSACKCLCMHIIKNNNINNNNDNNDNNNNNHNNHSNNVLCYVYACVCMYA